METLREKYDRVVSRVNRVYEIFQGYFGEDRVDLQGVKTFEQTSTSFGTRDASDRELQSFIFSSSPYLLVFFPEVTIANENERSVDIKELWAKIKILADGRLHSAFELNRSNYELEHLKSDYMHSHINGVNWSDPTAFMSPCLGDGPIRRTISSLCTQYDEDLWLLFCCELALYAGTESLSGGPWRRLEQIGAGNSGGRTPSEQNNTMTPIKHSFRFSSSLLMKDFVKYFLEKKVLKFCFINGAYYLGMSQYDFRILVSNHFIEWMNRQDNPWRIRTSYARLVSNGILGKYILKDNKIYLPRSSSFGRFSSEEEMRARFEGKRVLTFKGRTYNITINQQSNDPALNTTILVCKEMCESLLSLILRTVNFNYGITSNTNTGSATSSSFSGETKFL